MLQFYSFKPTRISAFYFDVLQFLNLLNLCLDHRIHILKCTIRHFY